MKEIKGSIFDQIADVICITTNGTVKKNGKAVMGKGVALEARKKFKSIDSILGEKLSKYGNHVFPLAYSHEYKVYSFPTKDNWWSKSDLNLIEKSCKDLAEWADEQHWKKIILPRPGCGNGKLKWEDVKQVLEKYFDDRFYIISEE